MNIWRLLLLAVVAVFQPIASFTDSNLIDGRQQCCGRLSSAPLQDTRSSLHETTRLAKTTSALRRLNDQDETREDRRYEVRQRVSIFSRPSTERPLVDIRNRVARQVPFEIARSSQELPANSQSGKRLLDVHQKQVRFTRDLKPLDLTHRVVDRSRNALERRNDRVYTESPRDRADFRTQRYGNERLSKNSFDSKRERQREQSRSVEGRITVNRDARRILSRTQDDNVPSFEGNHIYNHQHIAREKLSVVRRESKIEPDTRCTSDRNDERRNLQRTNEQRLSLTANTRLVDRTRVDNRENRLRMRINQRLSNERFDERREQTEERREFRQQNKENIERTSSDERMEIDRRITRESRIMNVQNERNVDGRRETRVTREKPDQRLSRERIVMDRRNVRESRTMNVKNTRNVADRRKNRISERQTRDENRENLEQRLSRERTQMDRKNIRESRTMTARNARNVDDRREKSINERQTRDENRENLDQRLSPERVLIDRRNVRESRTMNVKNTRNVADRRENRITERQTRDENRDNLEQRLYRERTQLDRKNIRESRTINARNTRNVNDRRENRLNERQTRNENRESLEQRLSPESTQMDRKNIRESRTMTARNTRNVDDRRESRINERITRGAQDINREILEQRLARETIQMDRGNTRESKMLYGQNTRNVADRREFRHKERVSRESQDDNRENREQILSHDRVQIDRRDVRESRIMNAQNTRNVAVRREIRNRERISRNAREARDHDNNRLSVERTQVDPNNFREFGVNLMDKRNIRELRTVNTPSDTEIDSRWEIRYNERSAEINKESRVNPEQRISQQRFQMDRRNIREFRNRNIIIRSDRREIRKGAELHTENRVNSDNRLSGARIQMHVRNIRESRIGNTLHTRDLDSRQEIRLARESREELRENPDRRFARESRQVDGQNIREFRVHRGAARNEQRIDTDTESRLETRTNERMSDQITRERREHSKSAERVNAEDRDSTMTDRRARSVERRNFREIRAEPRLTRSADSNRRSEVFSRRVEHTHRIENREREAIVARSRNVEMARNREKSPLMVGKMENDTVATWQYVLYTLQAAYLCALFMQMLTPSRAGKARKMSFRWLPVSSQYNPIKVD